MDKAFILKSDDTLEAVDYVDFNTIQAGVGGGLFCSCGTNMIYIGGEIAEEVPPSQDRYVPVHLYCNDEALCINNAEFNKCNAVATFICNNRIGIYGNVVIVAELETDDGMEARGFNEIEAKALVNTIDGIKEMFQEQIEEIHNDKDDNKPDPFIYVYN